MEITTPETSGKAVFFIWRRTTRSNVATERVSSKGKKAAPLFEEGSAFVDSALHDPTFNADVIVARPRQVGEDSTRASASLWRWVAESIFPNARKTRTRTKLFRQRIQRFECWLGRQDSNLGMAESKSKWFA